MKATGERSRETARKSYHRNKLSLENYEKNKIRFLILLMGSMKV